MHSIPFGACSNHFVLKIHFLILLHTQNIHGPRFSLVAKQKFTCGNAAIYHHFAIFFLLLLLFLCVTLWLFGIVKVCYFMKSVKMKNVTNRIWITRRSGRPERRRENKKRKVCSVRNLERWKLHNLQSFSDGNFSFCDFWLWLHDFFPSFFCRYLGRGEYFILKKTNAFSITAVCISSLWTVTQFSKLNPWAFDLGSIFECMSLWYQRII